MDNKPLNGSPQSICRVGSFRLWLKATFWIKCLLGCLVWFGFGFEPLVPDVNGQLLIFVGTLSPKMFS